MTPLTLTMRPRPGEVIELAGITPNALAGKSVKAMAKLRLGQGRRAPTLGEVFVIEGEDCNVLRFIGLTSACQRLGADMEHGLIEATGAHGDELGRGMLGGEIRVSGNVGEALGAGMRGGHIVVRGSAGARLGGVIAGSTRGMNGGVILVTKHAGDCAGERMRRGLILIAGNAGRHLGDRMTAGTIAVLGQAASGAGAGLRRGTLLLAQMPVELSPNFNDCGEFELAMMPLIQGHVAEIDRAFARRLSAFQQVRRWCGDMSFGGKGEILIASQR